MRHAGKSVILFACLGASSFQYAHGAYPERPIRVVVPYVPGGNIDITARTIAPGMSAELGQQVVIDNRGGANGSVGQALVSNAPADGYTLVLTSISALVTTPALSGQFDYDAMKHFSPITMVTRVPIIMVVRLGLPARNVKEFITLAKSQPEKFIMASGGTGSAGHLTGVLFQTLTGTKLTHVSYKGAGQAHLDVLSGQVDVYFDQLSSAMSLIRAERLRVLAVLTRSRSAEIPDVPTMEEAGVAECESGITSGLLAPARTPAAIVGKLRDAIVKVLRTTSVRESFARLGAEAVESTPQEFTQFLRTDTERWTKVIQLTGVKPN